ncbi:tol-pal system YbgF family protein [Roseivirga sp. BDSF3-8]|uniref:tetratricopeptide repeat protein n=1 Tax=Roseivirga sp. BDSF3-8 TaxID=3241598 RepID=UPI0035323481
MKNIAWLALIPQFCIFLLLAFAFNLAGVNDPGIYAFFTFLALSILLRLIPGEHRKAVSAYHKGAYREAIAHFEKSYAFFSRHAWLDRTRYISLLSASKMAYREMALLNIAYSHGQLGNLSEMRKYVERTVKEFPKSKPARGALALMDEHENEEGY